MKEDSHYFDNKTVLVFGFGSNGGGLGTVEFLLSTSVQQIIVTDQRGLGELTSTANKVPFDERLVWRLGAHEEEDFKVADIVIKNPGIARDHPLLVIAEEHGAEVVMDSTLFMRLCRAPVLGVTGSKGKTTTASLLVHILATAGYKVISAGISQTGVLSELLKVEEESVVVFELSSWRLSGLASVEKSPAVSVITNLYPDHLNYYGTMQEYAKDKKIITQFQTPEDTLIVPHDNQWTKYFVEESLAQVKEFGTTRKQHGWQDERALYIRSAEGDEEILQKENSFFVGDHIFANFLAAALAAESFGVEITYIREALQTFQGVPHRFQLVKDIDGVRYINDTAATIPAATLSSVLSVAGPVVLLAGGSDKGLPLDDLVTAFKSIKFGVLFNGTGTEKLIPLLEENSITHYQIADSMEEALVVAQQHADSGDSILLAPGAASFGMFKNEFDRGDQFIQAVEQMVQ